MPKSCLPTQKGERYYSKQPTERKEQVKVAGSEAKEECEPTSHLQHSHAELHTTWASGGYRAR